MKIFKKDNVLLQIALSLGEEKSNSCLLDTVPLQKEP
jgi:hypothetical protein